jgi:hypothetical protein
MTKSSKLSCSPHNAAESPLRQAVLSIASIHLSEYFILIAIRLGLASETLKTIIADTSSSMRTFGVTHLRQSIDSTRPIIDFPYTCHMLDELVKVRNHESLT